MPFDPLCPPRLRMLTVRRCPECGFEFERTRVFDLTRRRHAFRFERNWNRTPLRALPVTFRRALRPGSFRARDSLYDEVRVGPLPLVPVLGIPPGPATTVALAHGADKILALLGVDPRESRIAGALRFPGAVTRAPRSGLGRPTRVSWTGGPSLAAVMLCTLQRTLPRGRVRTAYVVRVAACAALGGGTVRGVACVPWAVLRTLPAPPRFVVNATGWVLLAFVPAAFVATGLRRYRHLPRASLVALTLRGIGLLPVFTVRLKLYPYGR